MTEDQARHVYKMVEIDKVINIETKKQEIKDDKMTRNRLSEENNTEANPYQMPILNKVTKKQEIKDDKMIRNRLSEEDNTEANLTKWQFYIK